MSPTRCPRCRRALALREDLRGALVRCPLCGATFRAGPARPSGTGWVGWLLILLALLLLLMDFGGTTTLGTTIRGYFTSINSKL
jgi:hypothetical protein